MTRPAPLITIAPAPPEAYAELARFHYRAGPPAPPVLTLAAHLEGHPAGVLTISMPVLNAPWRTALWTRPPRARTNAARARATNRLVRTVSRVIVHPRFRSMGVATALLRAYLRRPLTRYTEAVAALGAWSPIFTACGMRAVPVPRARRDLRLARTLRTLRVPAWTLLDVERAERLMRRPAIRQAVERWTADGRSTRALLEHARPWERAARAASAVLARPTAYGFDRLRDRPRAPQGAPR